MVERRASPDLVGSRAGGLHSRTIVRRASSLGRTHHCPARNHRRATNPGCAAHAVRRDAIGTGHPLRSRRRTPPPRTPHARSRSHHRQRPASNLHLVARGPTGVTQPRRARRLRHHSMDGSGQVDRCKICRHVGASRAGRSQCSHGRFDSTRRLCRLGERSGSLESPSRTGEVVRAASGLGQHRSFRVYRHNR